MTTSLTTDTAIWSPARTQDGTGFLATPDHGFLVSYDNGMTWKRAFATVPEAASLPVTEVALSPEFAIDGLVLAAIPGGIGVSRDRGMSWAFARLPGPLPIVTCLLIVPDDGRPFLLAGTLEDGIARSTDGGASWAFWNGGLFDREVIALAWDEDRCIVVAVTPSGSYHSRNGGRSWHPFDTTTT